MALVPIISQTWDTTSIFNPTRMNNIEQNLAIVSDATGVKYSNGVSIKDKIDELKNNLINTYLTYNSSSSVFEFQSGTPEPTLPQLTLIVRNTANGSIYSIWYSNANHCFYLGNVISGSAPANGNNVNVQYFR